VGRHNEAFGGLDVAKARHAVAVADEGPQGRGYRVNVVEIGTRVGRIDRCYIMLCCYGDIYLGVPRELFARHHNTARRPYC